MKKQFSWMIFLLVITSISGCSFISNTFQYSDTTKSFFDHLLRAEYDACIQLMAIDDAAADSTKEDLKLGLVNFREVVVENFGEKVEYTLMRAEKKWSTEDGEGTRPNTTKLFMQFSNGKEFGVLEALFDDKSQKILNIKTLDVKESIPGMTMFWLFGIIALCVPAFNIYVIRRIKKSAYKKKWLKYLGVIALNVPTITYVSIGKISLELFSLQILCGIGFEYMGYINSAWYVGIPLGGLYFLWQLEKGKDKLVDPTPVDTPALYEETSTEVV
ncbi:hypothetical protein [Aridibaculum aurantiacum]|uniref:hypothetical protein n=1 Tax=Aridibaculum aurantiacum TaxID=2810307 RepID=UPI001A9625B1|nr:hypothetical protein [Aridibaculum aurantiacum]